MLIFAQVEIIRKEPAVVRGLYNLISKFSSLMHQFFGNAADIDASSSQAPCVSMLSLLDIIDNKNLQSMPLSLESSG